MATWRPATLTPTDARGPLPPHATAPPVRRRGLKLLERLLLVIGLICLGYYGYVLGESALYQAYETRELDKILANGNASAYTEERVAPTAPRPRPATGSTLGRLEIAFRRQEKVDRGAMLVDGPVQIAPLAADLDVGLVDPD